MCPSLATFFFAALGRYLAYADFFSISYITRSPPKSFLSLFLSSILSGTHSILRIIIASGSFSTIG